MEAILILFVIGIIGYLIYQSLPSSKFEKAQAFFKIKNYIEAASILDEIFDKHQDAPAKFAECKLILSQALKGNTERLEALNEIITLRQRITNTTSIVEFQYFEARALLEIARIQFEGCNGDIDKLNQNVKFIDNAIKNGSESDFSSLRRSHFYDLANSYFKRAEEKERLNRIIEAIQNYNSGKDCAEKSTNNIVKHNSIARIEICKLKLLSLEYK
jgi:hypothetical protein